MYNTFWIRKQKVVAKGAENSFVLILLLPLGEMLLKLLTSSVVNASLINITVFSMGL